MLFQSTYLLQLVSGGYSVHMQLPHFLERNNYWNIFLLMPAFPFSSFFSAAPTIGLVIRPKHIDLFVTVFLHLAPWLHLSTTAGYPYSCCSTTEKIVHLHRLSSTFPPEKKRALSHPSNWERTFQTRSTSVTRAVVVSWVCHFNILGWMQCKKKSQRIESGRIKENKQPIIPRKWKFKEMRWYIWPHNEQKDRFEMLHYANRI